MKTYELILPESLLGDKKRISLVKSPAVEIPLMKFNKNEPIQMYFSDKEKRIIYAPAMVPNKLIFRSEINKPDYQVFYSEDTVEKFRDQYFKCQGNVKSNLYHMDSDIEGVDVVESWIVKDPLNDKSSSMGFKDITKGTWFIGMKINSDEVWNDHIKTGKIDGLSIEGQFLHELISEDKTTQESKQLFNKQNSMNKNAIKSTLFSAIKRIAMASELVETIVEGVSYFSTDLNEGSIITDKEGNPMPKVEFTLDGVMYKTDEIGAILPQVKEELMEGELPAIEEDVVVEDEMAKLKAELELVKAENEALKAEIAKSKEDLSLVEADKVKAESQLVTMAKQTLSAKSIGLNPNVKMSKSYKDMTARERFDFERQSRN